MNNNNQNNQSTCVTYDVIVVGAGAAGLQAGALLQERNLNYLIIEKNSMVAGHWKKYPRHRKLISINKKYTGSDHPDFNLRHDWNSLLDTVDNPVLFTEYTEDLYPNADVLYQYLVDFYERHQLNVLFNTAIRQISRLENGNFQLLSDDDSFNCRYLFLATGPLPYTPNIPGVDLPGVFTYDNMPMDRDIYKNKRVLIIGKGNSGFETAEAISGYAAVAHLSSPSMISFAWNTHYVGGVRALHNNILDMYQLKSQHGIINGSIAKIERIEDGGPQFEVSFQFSLTPEDPYSCIRYDHVIVCTGYRYVDLSLFDLDTVPVQINQDKEQRNKYPKLTSSYQFEGVSGMYALGPLTQGLPYQFKKNAGGFLHGFRYTIRTAINIFLHEELGVPLPQKEFPSHSQVLTDHMMYRMNTTSALYQMYGELVDIIVSDGNIMRYYYELPYEYAKKKFSDTSFVALMFKYGDRGGVDAFRYVLQATPSSPEKSVFLHPVLHYVENGEEVDQRHILESLETVWTDESLHIRPTQEFVSNHLSC